jgi:limonene-1,2-epoxide hydrolase
MDTGAYSSVMATPSEVVRRFVEAFVSAWPAADAARVAALFTEDASYHNGPLEPVHGRDAIETTLAGFMALGGEVAVDMVNMLADDQVVMTERVDHFAIGGKTFALPVMGACSRSKAIRSVHGVTTSILPSSVRRSRKSSDRERHLTASSCAIRAADLTRSETHPASVTDAFCSTERRR